MKREPSLTARNEQILCSIVRSYIDSGEPVASNDISRLRRFQLSPASIRMVMSDLAGAGYLHQPHTSAGRVPTEKAFQTFVDLLPQHRVVSAEVGRIRDSLSEEGSVERRVERCSRMLTEMTAGVGITAAIPTTSQTLEQVELVCLGGRRVLMIVVTRDRLVRNQVVTLDEDVTQDDLTTLRNYVNREFGGWVLSDVQEELRKRLEASRAAYDRMYKQLLSLYQHGLLDIGLEPEVHMEGAANLLGFDLHVTRDHLKSLFQALAEKKRVLELLARFLEADPAQSGRPVRVKIGLGAEPHGLEEMALIGLTVPMPGGAAARFAVVGPMRMDYSKAMSAVLHVGRAFSSLPV